MKKNSPNEMLDAAIELLESKRGIELIQLKEQVNDVLESLKPINLIKETFKKVTASPDLKSGFGKTAIGIASGLLIKIFLFRKTHNPLKILARTALQTAIAGIASYNSDKIKSTGQGVFRALFSRSRR